MPTMPTDGEQIAGSSVLAGIDEAGFGPILGPLVIGATAWRVPIDSDGTDLWERLRGGVTRTPSRRLARLAINDSKKLYNRQKGLAELERGVLGTLTARSESSENLPRRFADFAGHVAPSWQQELAEHPWYADHDALELPVASDPADVAVRANGLRVAMKRSGVNLLGAGVEIVAEARYNRLSDAMRNKSMMLFSCTARLIQRLLEKFGRQGLKIVCDKHGGRNSYRQVLSDHWPTMHVTVLTEGADASGYVLADGGSGQQMEIWFVPEGDATYLPVALASMYSKYTRELCMELLNRFWQSHCSGELKSTAGYFTDGQRFAREVESAARNLGIEPRQYIRQR